MLLNVGEPSSGHEWRDFQPRLVSEVKKLDRAEASVLLHQFCSGLRNVEQVGLTCSTNELGPAFSDIVDNSFQAEGVIFGRFLNPDSEDAVVSGWSFEGHPSRWGGTLLLTKRGNQWIPLWYKSALITHSCETLKLPNGRQILLCEDEDGGMGHQFHYLYTVDLTKPPFEQNIADAHSFKDECVSQKQAFDPIEWLGDRLAVTIPLRTLQWRKLRSGDCGPHPPVRPPTVATRRFAVTQAGVIPSRSVPR